VKKMFAMYALGKEGTQTICRKLNDTGCRRRSGKKWDKRVILNILRNPVYVGKLRWREVSYEGNHDAIVSEVLFSQAQELLDQRREDVSGRRWNNGSRLLSGLMKCGRCQRPMVGISCRKKEGESVPYYVCTQRLSTHDCEQDYVRADLLETAVVQDLKAMFQDEGLMARIWAEANKRLDSEKPDLAKDIRRVESQMADVRARLERYLEAFETGKLAADVCNQKVRDLKARLAELEADRRGLEERRERLSLPAMDRECLRKILADFEEVMATAENPKMKHLLRRLVKKVLVHDRHTVEVWYGLPRPGSVRIEGKLAGRTSLDKLPYPDPVRIEGKLAPRLGLSSNSSLFFSSLS
jgi:site-specific DNA recombinase